MDLLRSQLDLLASTPLFSLPTRQLNDKQRAILAYQRAKAISSCYGFTVDDILELRPKFWELHSHPIMTMDIAALSLLSIQLNLTAGTIARYLDERPDLTGLVNDLLSYKSHGQYMLTEIGHGLDAFNLETTATYTSDGFILHTPRPSAAKFMPPTIPAGQLCIAVVFARLVVEGEDHGIRPFLVPLNDGKTMTPGISARLLPYRAGTNPMNHCLTTFTRVKLPSTALLGSIKKSSMPHPEFLQSIWRISVGSIALACPALSLLEIFATIGTKYSLRRTVGNPPAPILQFRTQQQPILTTVAQAYVLRAFRSWAIEQFTDQSEDPRVRHGIATCCKVVMAQHALASSLAISERCGAQGLFDHNQLIMLHVALRGMAIAEGDILALSIRLNSELLLDRYALPSPIDDDSLLARHERGLLNEQRQILSTFKSHRSSDFNKHLLPRSQFTIESIGHRMAYEAAIRAGVDADLVALYEADVIRQDPSWYLAHAGLTRDTIFTIHNKAMDAILPRLESLVDHFGVEPYVTAPICSDQAWENFVDGLETVGDLGDSDPLQRIMARL